MRKKRNAPKKPTRTQALEERMSKVERRLPEKKKNGFVEHLKTLGTGMAIASVIYARKDPREALTIIKERLDDYLS